MSIMIIAEAGSNHNGSMKRAKDLVMAAAQIGASSIKFQFIFADGLYLPKYLDDDKYIINSVYDIRKSEELAKNQWSEIWSEANDNNIDISASVFCSQGVKLLSFLGANFVKISSTDLTNIRLIEEACDNFDTVIISTGMSSIDEIYKTVNFISGQYNKTNLKLMHCVSVYPCDLKESNISRIKVLKDYFGLEVGYSDHTETEISAVLALMSGASFFEKHFTTNKNLSGFDHKYALDPNEFKKYIDVDVDLVKDEITNTIILAQACRHAIVHDGSILNSKVIRQVSNANPRMIKEELAEGKGVEFDIDEIRTIGKCMEAYMARLCEKIDSNILTKVKI